MCAVCSAGARLEPPPCSKARGRAPRRLLPPAPAPARFCALLLHLQVWVYEEADERGPANLYVHHSLMLPAFPLSVAWMDCDPTGRVSFVSFGLKVCLSATELATQTLVGCRVRLGVCRFMWAQHR